MSTGATLLGTAWGMVVATPLVVRARTGSRRLRARALGAGQPRHRSWGLRVPARPRVLVAPAERRARRRRDAALASELPVTIDLLGVAVGSGCTPFIALDVAARWAPPSVAAHLHEVGRACTLGRRLVDALEDLARDVPRLQGLTEALAASDRYGAPVGDALDRLAVEERANLRRAAETRARAAPVRLLFPLVLLVLPAFGLLTVVPVLLTGLGGASS